MMRTTMRRWAVAAVLGMMAGVSGPANAEFVTFDELPTRPLNGTSLKGVTFGFTINGVASTQATFNTFVGPLGVPPFISPPNAEGSSFGVVSFAFDAPSSAISFGLARNAAAGTAGATVELFSGDTSLGTAPVTLSPVVIQPPGGVFLEGLFASTATDVTRGTITFTNPSAAPRFTLDNFGFTPIPEPSSLALCGVASLVGLGAWSRRRRPAA